ncbi:hypothetical protein FRC19_000412 [Serendipita sp. 401]|nr:hypothetical protein FRC19_000412 [Serendipita sp. 401]
MDVAMLRTLAKIRNKDPTIYDSKKNVFEDEKDTVSNLRMKKTSKEKTKTLTIKQHALNSILDPNGSRTPSPAPLTYAKEQEILKKETVQAFKSAVVSGSEDSDEDGFLVPREKTKGEIEQEQEEYRAVLQREIGPNVDIKELITVDEGIERIHEAGEGDTTMPSKKKKKRKDSKQDRAKKEQSDQDFLANYILNRGWIDQSTRRLPTYDEVTRVKDSKEKHKNKKQKEGEHETASATLVEDTPSQGAQENMDDIDEEDDFDDLTERFESSYNFRFEEPGAETIATYPRSLPSVVRRPDTSRKEAREKRKERKEEEMAQKKEEVNRLKALKMREIKSKIDRIQQEGGKRIKEDILRRFEDDLDEEWDATQHDARMRQLYDEEFAGVEDDEKPQWADDIDIADIVDSSEIIEETSTRKQKSKKKATEQADYDAVDEDQMDADVEHDWNWEEANWDGTDESRKRLVDKYMDEVYGLEFNDMVGDLPVRFKYTSVPSTSYALDPVEILMATDKELNEYMSIKKFAPYKKKNSWDNDRNSKLQQLRQQLGSRTWDGVPLSEWTGPANGRISEHAGGFGVDSKKKKRLGKKERNRVKSVAQATTSNEPATQEEHRSQSIAQYEPETVEEGERPKKKRKKGNI